MGVLRYSPDWSAHCGVCDSFDSLAWQVPPSLNRVPDQVVAIERNPAKPALPAEKDAVKPGSLPGEAAGASTAVNMGTAGAKLDGTYSPGKTSA